jgi:hypothetical protein
LVSSGSVGGYICGGTRRSTRTSTNISSNRPRRDQESTANYSRTTRKASPGALLVSSGSVGGYICGGTRRPAWDWVAFPLAEEITPELQGRHLPYELHRIHSNHSQPEIHLVCKARVSRCSLGLFGVCWRIYLWRYASTCVGLGRLSTRRERRPNPTQVDAYLHKYILQQTPKRPREHRELLQNFPLAEDPRGQASPALWLLVRLTW